VFGRVKKSQLKAAKHRHTQKQPEKLKHEKCNERAGMGNRAHVVSGLVDDITVLSMNFFYKSSWALDGQNHRVESAMTTQRGFIMPMKP